MDHKATYQKTITLGLLKQLSSRINDKYTDDEIKDDHVRIRAKYEKGIVKTMFQHLKQTKNKGHVAKKMPVHDKLQLSQFVLS